MEQVAINWYSVVGAAIVGFVLGGLWYGPLFGKPWMRSIGMNPETAKDAAKTGLGKILGITFVLLICMSYCLAMFLGTDISTQMGALYGFFTGFFWVAFALAVNALYEQKPWNYMLINGAYWTLTFTLMGTVLGTWHG